MLNDLNDKLLEKVEEFEKKIDELYVEVEQWTKCQFSELKKFIESRLRQAIPTQINQYSKVVKNLKKIVNANLYTNRLKIKQIINSKKRKNKPNNKNLSLDLLYLDKSFSNEIKTDLKLDSILKELVEITKENKQAVLKKNGNKLTNSDNNDNNGSNNKNNFFLKIFLNRVKKLTRIYNQVK